MKNTILILFILFGFLKPNFSQVPVYVPSTGLVGWWPFNGNANDNSGNGNNGVVHGATLTTDRFGINNNAYNFVVNATAGWGNAQNRIVVSSPSIPNTNSFTMSSWVMVDSKPSPYSNRASSIMGRWGGAGQEIFRNQISNNTTYLTINNPTLNFTSGTTTLNPQWNHVCLTYDGSKITHYLNGNVIYSNIINITLPTSSVNLTFGEIHMSNGHWYLLDGKLDDLGYWSVALDSCQVQNLYTGGSGNCCVTNFQFSQDTIFYCGTDSVQLDAGSGWTSYSWNTGDSIQNPFVSTSGMYSVTVFDSIGCMGYDSVFFSKNNYTTSSLSITSCDRYTWTQNSVDYLASGIYKDTITNSAGCDSIITLNLTINNSSTSSLSIISCDSYTWAQNSVNYLTSGVYKDTITNSEGCDSIITLNLTINNSSTSSSSIIACDSYTWVQNSVNYLTSGIYKDTITNSAGCDSVITLNLTINNSSTSILSITACDNYTWAQNSVNYLTSGIYKDTIANSEGCDSVITLNLTINNPPTITVQPIYQNTTIGANAVFQVMATGSGLIYQWQQNDGTGFINISTFGQFSGTNTNTLTITNVTANMQQFGYRCIISNRNGCTDTSNFATLNISLTDLLEVKFKYLVSIYPNPTKENITIETNINYSSVKVFNLNGQLVLESVFNRTINVSGLQKGSYFIQLISDEQEIVSTGNFIKK
jgi:hypothetical protein|tara:strand:+ start:7672 stop:9780 length:2109 start_codon:yes stop_codon:yes gene_type:complete